MFDATQMPFYVKNNLILFKIDDQGVDGRSGYTVGKDHIIVINV